MSQDLQAYLRSRAHLGELRWGAGLGLSLGLHLAVGLAFFWPRGGGADKVEEAKVTWVNLPAAMAGASGGSEAMEVGKTGERLRRVEEVAPVRETTPSATAPDPFAAKTTKAAAKGDSKDTASQGTGTTAAKGKTAAPNPVAGAVGSGNGAAFGAGSGIPGLNPSSGVQGGVGLVGGVDGDFPFVWYLQQVQARITSNWNRVSSTQGRVQIYFRIGRDGTVDRVRIEVPSGNAAMDESARMAVLRAAPLQRLPEGYEGAYLGVRFWFTYLGN
ncbi:energy transducer TonB [Geothrix sp. 21YS21S-4]|uniref:energy transducer TonB n=1 Tax=Geothrix sp. 21YS21S-4 TaxID=3068889 RepID=UPI0027B968CC|nr:energy transducer TonB [Geothrix sp. 21YS21S-4]